MYATWYSLISIEGGFVLFIWKQLLTHYINPTGQAELFGHDINTFLSTFIEVPSISMFTPK